MADTGLPWELPYPLPTDLVRDGADAIKDLAEAVAAGLDEAGNAGIGSNVVQTVKTDTFTTTSTSYVDVTGLTATITPSVNTSKVLVVAFAVYSNATDGGATYLSLVRDSTAVLLGDTAGSRVSSTLGWRASAFHNTSTQNGSIVYLDSPTSASPVVYKLQMRVSSGTGVIGRNGSDTDATSDGRYAASIVLVEVAA